MVECKDSNENLRKILDPVKDQINALNAMTWNDKNLRVFLFWEPQETQSVLFLGTTRTSECSFSGNHKNLRVFLFWEPQEPQSVPFRGQFLVEAVIWDFWSAEFSSMSLV